jgi:hypothetical protein
MIMLVSQECHVYIFRDNTVQFWRKCSTQSLHFVQNTIDKTDHILFQFMQCIHYYYNTVYMLMHLMTNILFNHFNYKSFTIDNPASTLFFNFHLASPSHSQGFKIQKISVFVSIIRTKQNWDNTVGIVTSYRLDNQGARVWVLLGSRIFFSLHPPDRLWGTPRFLSNGYPELFPPGTNRPGHEPHHSLPTSAKFKKMWIHFLIHLHDSA